MKLLLDTHVWLWMVAQPGRLSLRARRLLVDPANELLLSAVSGWEIAIKHALGKLPLPRSPARYVPDQIEKTGVIPLPIAMSHVLHVSSLRAHHRDPFDRLLVAQAILEEAVLVTSDPRFESYGIERVFAG